MAKADPPQYYSILLDRVANPYIADEDVKRPPALEAQKERLRTFLVYCLGLEYNVPKVKRVARPDWPYFVWLSGSLSYLKQLESTTDNEVQQICRLTKFFDMHLTDPCDSLNVPAATVAAKIRFFTLARDFHGRISFTQKDYWLRDPSLLASKILVDRDIILPAILSDPEDSLRGEMHQSIVAESRFWFKSLEDPDTFELHERTLKWHYDAQQTEAAIKQWTPSKFDLKMMEIWSKKIRQTEWKFPYDVGPRDVLDKKSEKKIKKVAAKEPPLRADLVAEDGGSLILTVTSSKGRQVLRYESARGFCIEEC